MLSRLVCVVLLFLFATTITALHVSFKTDGINFHDTSMYQIRSTDFALTTKGELTIDSNSNSAEINFLKKDGKVFFEISRDGGSGGHRGCVVLAEANGKVTVVSQHGTNCGFEIEIDLMFTVADSEIDDCEWDGKSCHQTKQLKTDFEIMNSKEFEFGEIIENPRTARDSSATFESKQQATTLLTTSVGSYFFNVTSKDGKSWCLISSEANIVTWLPISVVYESYNAECSSISTGYHSFAVTPQVMNGFICQFNGISCV